MQQSSIAWLNPRNIAFRSDSFMTILNMINKTDLIGFLPSYLYDFISPTMQLHAINIDNLFRISRSTLITTMHLRKIIF